MMKGLCWVTLQLLSDRVEHQKCGEEVEVEGSRDTRVPTFSVVFHPLSKRRKGSCLWKVLRIESVLLFN